MCDRHKRLNAFRKHLFGREYMSGVDREKVRVKATGEVFTPTGLVEEVLDETVMSGLGGLGNRTFLDPCCGDGQFLASVLMRKLENGYDDNFEAALRTLYGVDLMQDNVDLCRERLLCGREDWELEDPVGQAYEVYEATAAEIERRLKLLLTHSSSD